MYVGEETTIDIVFKYKEHTNIRRIQIDELVINGFAIKRLKSVKPTKQQGYIVYKESYIVSPLKTGNFTINSHKVTIGTNSQQTDFFGMTLLKWQKAYSNTVSIKVLPIPQDIRVIGDFNISATIDKTQTAPNKPINMYVSITGYGNTEDIENFKLDIQGVSVFSEAPTTKRAKNSTIWTQKFSLISESSYKIPQMSFKFFHKSTKTIKTIKTKSFDIKVVGKTTAKPKLIEKPKKPKKPKTKKSINTDYRYYYGFAGLILGGLIVLLYLKFVPKNRRELENDTQIAIKKSKNDKELYVVLSKLDNARIISDILDALEQNIYKNTKYKINKNDIIKRLQKTDDEYLYS